MATGTVQFQFGTIASPPPGLAVMADAVNDTDHGAGTAQYIKVMDGRTGGTIKQAVTASGAEVDVTRVQGTVQTLGSIQGVGTFQVLGSVQLVGTNQALGTVQPLAGSVHVANVVFGTVQTHGTSQVLGSVQTVGTSQVLGSVQTVGTSQVLGSVQTHGTSQVLGSVQTVGTSQVLGTVQTHGTSQVLGTFQPLAGSVHLASGTVQVLGSVQTVGTSQVLGSVQGVGTFQALGSVQTVGTAQVLGTVATFPIYTTVSVTLTRPNDTTAYAANDEISDSTSAPSVNTITSAARATGGMVRMLSCECIDSANASTKAQLVVFIFDTTTTPNNDNSAFAPSDSVMNTCVGVVPFNVWYPGDDTSGATGNALSPYLGPAIEMKTAASANLFFRVKVLNAYTPVAQEAFVFRFVLVQY